jgi:hypothetical protein
MFSTKFQLKSFYKLGMVVHACNSGYLEGWAGMITCVQEFETSLGQYRENSLNQNQTATEKNVCIILLNKSWIPILMTGHHICYFLSPS